MSNQNAVAKRPDNQTVAEQTGLEVRQVDGGMVTMFKSPDGSMKPYVGAAGRRYKMDERFGAGEYRVDAHLPDLDTYKVLRQMWGIAQGAPCIIMECEILDKQGNLMARDYGTATPRNMLGGQKQFDERGLEIATTRSINRAMGQLTASGFGDVDNKAASAYREAPMPYQSDFLQLCQEVKKKVGERAYYAILGNYGAEHANDAAVLSDPVMMQQIADDLKAARSRDASHAVFGDGEIDTRTKPEDDEPAKASEDDIKKIRELAESAFINDRERSGIERRIADGMNYVQAEEAKTWLEEQIEGRREQADGGGQEGDGDASEGAQGAAQDHPGDAPIPTTFGAVVAFAEENQVSPAWVKEQAMKINEDIEAMDPDQLLQLRQKVQEAVEKKQ